MNSPARREHLRENIHLKRANDDRADWHAPAPFPGWTTRGTLPHCDEPALIQFVTYRLSDSVPPTQHSEWAGLLQIEDHRRRATCLEAFLDRGLGGCCLRRPEIAGIVEQNWLHFDGVHYRLLAWVVMPNHVHLLLEIWDKPLASLAKSWKGYSARNINRILGRTGTLWQEEYWDRYIRDEEHFQKALRYVEGNPVRARLARDPADWPFSSANPRWTWTASDSRSRYRNAHLETESWKRRMTPTPAGMHAADVAVRAPNGATPADVAVRAPNGTTPADVAVRAPNGATPADVAVRAPHTTTSASRP